MDERERTQWWQKTEVLTGVSMTGLLFVGVSPLMVSPDATLLGVPLRYFMAAVIVPAVLVAGVFWAAARQESLNRRHGASGP